MIPTRLLRRGRRQICRRTIIRVIQRYPTHTRIPIPLHLLIVTGKHDIYTLTFTGNEFTIGANASDVESFWDNGWELDPDADGDGHCEVTMEVIEQ